MITPNIEICPDCATNDAKLITTIIDPKFAGRVCPRCERIYTFDQPMSSDKRYTTKPKAMAAMRVDSLRKRHRTNSTREMVTRIMRSDS